LSTEKIFIIGLPRTATTSVCLAMLELGFKTAHTAYTHDTFAQAEVIADTPVFCDYAKLDALYPQAKYIYLTRKLSAWLPSIRQLLTRMFVNLQRSDGGSNPMLRRCFNEVFFPLTPENIHQDDFLSACYLRHQQDVENFFKGREQDLLTIDVSEADSFNQLVNFLRLNAKSVKSEANIHGFERINIGSKITAWNKVRHPLKVASTNKGKIDKMI
jgi:hypothetical protein